MYGALRRDFGEQPATTEEVDGRIRSYQHDTEGSLSTANGKAALQEQAPKDIVLGRHPVARGLKPGKAFGDILARCREVQDEKGWDDPERILDHVLEKGESG